MRTQRTQGPRRFGLAALLCLLVSPAWAASVSPVLLQGNQTDCAAINPAWSTVAFDAPSGSGSQTVGPVTVTYTDSKHFDWTSSLGIDAVVVKGGPDANLFRYDPPQESFGDTNLYAPANCGGGTQQCGLSHMLFCVDYELTVSKTALATYDRRYEWTIDKSVSPELLNLFQGDSADVNYTVTLTRSAPIDYNAKIAGTVTIANPAPFAATITGISDALSGADISASLNCGVSLPATLAAGASLTCSYAVDVADTSTRTNVVTVTTSGPVGGGSASAQAVFGDPSSVTLASVHVTDSNGQGWDFSGSGSQTYASTFSCGDLPGHDNTATIDQTGQNDSAHVGIACYNLGVSKTAATSWHRGWTWSIVKTYQSPPLDTDSDGNGTPDALLLADGQSVTLNYSVALNATHVDSDFAVSGQITVVNNNPSRAADLTQVVDGVSGGFGMPVNCPSLQIPAGGALVCSYAGSLPNADARTNTATATQQNHHYAADGTPSASGTTDYAGSAAVTFGAAPNSETDECVNVSDLFNTSLTPSALGTVCANQAPTTLPFSVGFTWDGTTLGTCTTIQVPNLARFVTNDSGTTGDSSVSINITNQDCGGPPPGGGCTLTPGYWKTHSKYGPAPYDDNWQNIAPSGEDSPFFLSAQSWYRVLWVAPKGNAYYILAHAYIAAVLNQFNGAYVPPDVQAALDQATALFNTYTPAQVGKWKGGDPTRAQFIALGAVLDMYNNGMYPDGPPHCTDPMASSN